MKEYGIIKKIDGNIATVSFGNDGGCALCGSKHDCSIKGKEIIVDYDASSNLNIGDAVELDIGSGIGIPAVILFLLMPLAFIFIAYFTASWYSPNNEALKNWSAIIAIFVALGLATIIVKKTKLARRPKIISKQ